ncbi:MAG: LysR family transcriptional regulator substrate-binding protein, partial [Treponema sp.]|nr:LysR family transcriptional regulator substrate-binding protein [Treponema sp.]
MLEKKKICVLAGKDHPLAERSSVALGELRGENIIVMNSPMFGDVTIAGLCRQNKLTPKLELNYADWGLIFGLCRTGGFISLLPYSQADS